MSAPTTTLPFKFPWPLAVVLLVTWCLSSAVIARPADPYDEDSDEQPTQRPAVRHDGPPDPPNRPPRNFEEPMLGDMPAADDDDRRAVTEMPDVFGDGIDTLAVLNRESPAESEDDEDRDKQMRIKTIQNTIVSYMGWASRTPSPIPIPKTQTNVSMLIPSIQQTDAMRALYDANVNSFPAYPSDAFTEKIQSFYPVCELPKNMNEEVWNSKDTMNLIFNISVPKASNGVSVNVSTVKLRLFKQFVSCYFSQSSNETDDAQASCQPTSSEESIKRSANANLSSSSAENPSLMDDDLIRVSIYVRPLKKKKTKRKLLDSRMMPLHGEKWTEWNIHRAVKNWRSPVRSFALSIEVEDEYGNFLPVNRFFKPMNCTGDAQMTTPKPIPGFLMEAVHSGLPGNGNEAANMSAAQALSLNMYRYPIADVTTYESPESEDAEYRQAKDAFVQQSVADRVQAAAVGVQEQQQQHRIRHNGGGGGGNRHKINSTDLETAFAKLHQQHQQHAAASHLKSSAPSAAAASAAAVVDGAGTNAPSLTTTTEIPD